MSSATISARSFLAFRPEFIFAGFQDSGIWYVVQGAVAGMVVRFKKNVLTLGEKGWMSVVSRMFLTDFWPAGLSGQLRTPASSNRDVTSKNGNTASAPSDQI